MGNDLGVQNSSSSTFPNFPAKAKRVIYLYQEGAPSQLDTFDYKPGLKARYNEELPASIRGNQRLTGMTSGQTRLPIAPSIYSFEKHANHQDGVWISKLLRHTGGMAKEICLVKSMVTEQINHGPGVTFMQTGNQIPGRPSIGAWLSYGLGSANDDLPTFVVMISQGRGQMQALFSHLWGAGFLPGEHQGVQFRAAADPVLYLNDPKGMRRDDRRKVLDMIGEMNRREATTSGDSEVLARIAQYEMAYRMQTSVPELTDFRNENAVTLAMYGPDVQKPGTYAYNCLMARRMAERGVRFIQLYHRGWDHHGSIVKDLPLQCQDVDQPQAALLKDLKQRGLLEDTLVVWGGEFGRTVYCQGNLTPTQYGRDHHPRCFSMWLAGGGIQGGITHGETDDFSYNVLRDPVTAHDLHATMLHCLGIDHAKLTYKSQGLDMKLTGVEPSRVLNELLA
ncbi:MAG: DUF1501 domain-containing protein [Verrucomicrobia bacterium]|nr:DUF1501 domain-containing protein [Verrucomicrobiota bacterium]